MTPCRCRHCGTPFPVGAASRRIRRLLGAVIEAILHYLDELDGDVDLEPAADPEPSLGWSPPAGAGSAWAAQAGVDMED